MFALFNLYVIIVPYSILNLRRKVNIGDKGFAINDKEFIELIVCVNSLVCYPVSI